MSVNSVLDVIIWNDALEHYKARMRVHRRLLALHESRKTSAFAKLLLGISDNQGNYSARDHGLGPRILSENLNAEMSLFRVSEKFLTLENAYNVPKIIREANLKYFRIGVGSETSCMINPQVCWISNTRSIWTHLVFKHGGNFSRANEELELYRNEDETSEMAYRKWAAIHRDMKDTLAEILNQGSLRAKSALIEPGKVKYLWADAIANALYAYHHEE
ncbi:hypothetical protein JK169_14855 [Acetobacter persici]|uniref:hypothetical protein n=1 Tax=Acetobacter persici TaxID=1076596 RepID=UPI001BAB1321|nr:hypothetical protein [Acetobacter persici]MBS1002256.1 hypothetical protein [Acetobacter persici]